MDLLILFAQRKENYPGEYAPEALEIVTEYDYDENPDFINCKAIDAGKNPEFESAEIIRVQVDIEAIMRRLRPSEEPIKGTITDH